MHRSLLDKGLICRREDVRKLMQQLDPEGVELRRRRMLHRRKYHAAGPNYVWHIDGHDKLKPFGFNIHGCIDGFSRRLIWLEVSTTNKLPEVIAKYYLDAISDLSGIPTKISADDSTKHALIEPMHVYLSSLNRSDVEGSFSIITSPQNQRIERYWSILQRDRIGWWRRFFIDLTDVEMVDTSDPVALDCIQYYFMPLIRDDLNSILRQWNTHIISRRSNGGPSGRPDCMFYLPHLYGVESCLHTVKPEDIADFYPVATSAGCSV